VSYLVGCVLVAPSYECSRGLAGAVDQLLCAACCSNLAVLNHFVYSAALCGVCCAVSRPVWRKRRLLYYKVVSATSRETVLALSAAVEAISISNLCVNTVGSVTRKASSQ